MLPQLVIPVRRSAAAAILVALALAGVPVAAAPDLYAHDANGMLAIVDVANGDVTPIGDMPVMTDIAFAADGRLFAISFNQLFEVDPATAQATLVGFHGVPGGNALVFGPNGTLYAAGGTSTSLYAIDPTSGATSNLGVVGAQSAGDLAFHDGELYMASLANNLVQIDLGPPVAGATVGPFGFANVYGFATADDNVLYGLSGTQIFSVDTQTGAGAPVSDYGGQGLVEAYGSSFRSEAPIECPADPLAGCALAAQASLQVSEAKPGGEKLSFKMKGFDVAVSQADFGDPVGGATRIDVCLYDGSDAHVETFTIARAGSECGRKDCWRAIGTKGYAFGDAQAVSDGTRKLSLKGGPAGKGAIAFKAQNRASKQQAALPTGITGALAGATRASLRVITTDAACFAAELGTVKTATPEAFSASQ
jgi:hypothetical protein